MASNSINNINSKKINETLRKDSKFREGEVNQLNKLNKNKRNYPGSGQVIQLNSLPDNTLNNTTRASAFSKPEPVKNVRQSHNANISNKTCLHSSPEAVQSFQHDTNRELGQKSNVFDSMACNITDSIIINTITDKNKNTSKLESDFKSNNLTIDASNTTPYGSTQKYNNNLSLKNKSIKKLDNITTIKTESSSHKHTNFKLNSSKTPEKNVHLNTIHSCTSLVNNQNVGNNENNCNIDQIGGDNTPLIDNCCNELTPQKTNKKDKNKILTPLNIISPRSKSKIFNNTIVNKSKIALNKIALRKKPETKDTLINPKPANCARGDLPQTKQTCYKKPDMQIKRNYPVCKPSNIITITYSRIAYEKTKKAADRMKHLFEEMSREEVGNLSKREINNPEINNIGKVKKHIKSHNRQQQKLPKNFQNKTKNFSSQSANFSPTKLQTKTSKLTKLNILAGKDVSPSHNYKPTDNSKFDKISQIPNEKFSKTESTETVNIIENNIKHSGSISSYSSKASRVQLPDVRSLSSFSNRTNSKSQSKTTIHSDKDLNELTNDSSSRLLKYSSCNTNSLQPSNKSEFKSSTSSLSILKNKTHNYSDYSFHHKFSKHLRTKYNSYNKSHFVNGHRIVKNLRKGELSNKKPKTEKVKRILNLHTSDLKDYEDDQKENLNPDKIISDRPSSSIINIEEQNSFKYQRCPGYIAFHEEENGKCNHLPSEVLHMDRIWRCYKKNIPPPVKKDRWWNKNDETVKENLYKIELFTDDGYIILTFKQQQLRNYWYQHIQDEISECKDTIQPNKDENRPSVVYLHHHSLNLSHIQEVTDPLGKTARDKSPPPAVKLEYKKWRGNYWMCMTQDSIQLIKPSQDSEDSHSIVAEINFDNIQTLNTGDPEREKIRRKKRKKSTKTNLKIQPWVILVIGNKYPIFSWMKYSHHCIHADHNADFFGTKDESIKLLQQEYDKSTYKETNVKLIFEMPDWQFVKDLQNDFHKWRSQLNDRYTNLQLEYQKNPHEDPLAKKSDNGKSVNSQTHNIRNELFETLVSESVALMEFRNNPERWEIVERELDRRMKDIRSNVLSMCEKGRKLEKMKINVDSNKTSDSIQTPKFNVSSDQQDSNQILENKFNSTLPKSKNKKNVMELVNFVRNVIMNKQDIDVKSIKEIDHIKNQKPTLIKPKKPETSESTSGKIIEGSDNNPLCDRMDMFPSVNVDNIPFNSGNVSSYSNAKYLSKTEKLIDQMPHSTLIDYNKINQYTQGPPTDLNQIHLNLLQPVPQYIPSYNIEANKPHTLQQNDNIEKTTSCDEGDIEVQNILVEGKNALLSNDEYLESQHSSCLEMKPESKTTTSSKNTDKSTSLKVTSNVGEKSGTESSSYYETNIVNPRDYINYNKT